ncbi:MAG TPA: beta-propeller fold lactonase family protein, partial [Acetobacteraceae bacterium]
MRFRAASQAAVLAAFLAAPAFAGPNDILVGLDEKVSFEAQGQVYRSAGEKDAVLVMDVSNPAQPRISASLALVNSIAGPPTNLQITPDGKLGLVGNSLVVNPSASPLAPAPDDKIYVLDLSGPPRLADTVTVGKQPSGLAISRKGDLVLVANRAGKSVSVLTIEGGRVTHRGEVPVGDEVSAVAIAPDGKRGFVVKNTVHKVGVLAIDGATVTY